MFYSLLIPAHRSFKIHLPPEEIFNLTLNHFEINIENLSACSCLFHRKILDNLYLLRKMHSAQKSEIFPINYLSFL